MVANRGKVDGQQLGQKETQFQVDRRELDVHIEGDGIGKQILLLLQNSPGLLELGPADLGHSFRKNRRSQLTLRGPLFQVQMNPGMEQAAPVLEQGRFSGQGVSPIRRRESEQNDLGGQQSIRTEIEVVRIDMAKEDVAVEDAAFPMGHGYGLAAEAVNLADDAGKEVARNEDGSGIDRGHGVL